jgi:hypothetical protein
MEKLPLTGRDGLSSPRLRRRAMLATAHAVEISTSPHARCVTGSATSWGAGAIALAIALNWRGARPRLKQAMCILLGLTSGRRRDVIWHPLVEWKTFRR